MRDHHVIGIAAAVVVATWQGTAAAFVATLVLAVARFPARAVVLALLLAMLASVLGVRAWEHSQPRHLGPFTGWARIAADPVPRGAGLRVTLEIDGERFDAWCYGRLRATFDDRQAGDRAWIVATREAVPADDRYHAAIRHVVGRVRFEIVGDLVEGDALARSANRVRAAVQRSAERSMGDVDAALFTGLVIGDDRRQPDSVVDQFRAAGLSHLTAVSGQNVAYLLAAAAPALRRLRPWWRWSATVVLVGWFMMATRFEPSVVRAGAMGMLAATAFVTGRDVRPIRLLSLAVIALVLIDPLLVWSVGFWLSVGATVGVCAIAPRLEPHLPGPAWLRSPLAVTLGAQAGVAVPSVLVFGRLPVTALPANLLAVPVAGFVMLYGLPVGLLASTFPAPVTRLAMVPATVGTRWVGLVAAVAAAAEPSPRWSIAAWAVLLGTLSWLAVRRWHRPRPRVPI